MPDANNSNARLPRAEATTVRRRAASLVPAKPVPQRALDAVHYNIHHNVIRPGRDSSPDSIGTLTPPDAPLLEQGAFPSPLPSPAPSPLPSPVSSRAPSPAPEVPRAPEGFEEAYRAWLNGQVRIPNAPYIAPPLGPDPLGVAVGRDFAAWLMPEANEARQAAVGRRFVAACADAYAEPNRVLDTLLALHRVHDTDADERALYDYDTRTSALRVLIDVCDLAVVRDAEDILKAARTMPWTRLVNFSMAEGLGVVCDTLGTSALAVATYQAGVACGQKMAQAKVAGLGLKATGLAAGATVTGVATGLGVAATGMYAVGSVRTHYRTIQAFRDVWDNGFSRDAFFVHQTRDHVLGQRMNENLQPHCKHINSAWTEPNTLFRARWRRDFRGFDSIK